MEDFPLPGVKDARDESKTPNFSGPEYDELRDHKRLSKQHERVREAMRDGVWRSVRVIAKLTGDPENSIQAQLRHLRKPRFGGWIVEKRHLGKGKFEYKLRERLEDDPPYQGGKSTKTMKSRLAEIEEILEEALVEMEQSTDLFSRAKGTELRERLNEWEKR